MSESWDEAFKDMWSRVRTDQGLAGMIVDFRKQFERHYAAPEPLPREQTVTKAAAALCELMYNHGNPFTRGNHPSLFRVADNLRAALDQEEKENTHTAIAIMRHGQLIDRYDKLRELALEAVEWRRKWNFSGRCYCEDPFDRLLDALAEEAKR